MYVTISEISFIMLPHSHWMQGKILLAKYGDNIKNTARILSQYFSGRIAPCTCCDRADCLALLMFESVIHSICCGQVQSFSHPNPPLVPIAVAQKVWKRDVGGRLLHAVLWSLYNRSQGAQCHRR
jgi:hypothetical protein